MHLFFLKYLVLWRNFVEETRIVCRYYKNARFRKIDGALRKRYFWTNPFTISKRFLLARGETAIHAYGETPLTTLEMIVRQSGLKGSDTLFELGCGRGRGCFWLANFVGCKVVGIDFVPKFIENAKAIQKKYNLSNCTFRWEDLAESDFTGATVVYLYGTCYEDPFITMLAKKFSLLPLTTKIITVSYPLSDYDPQFKVVHQFSAPFTWGEGIVYLNIKL